MEEAQKERQEERVMLVVEEKEADERARGVVSLAQPR